MIEVELSPSFKIIVRKVKNVRDGQDKIDARCWLKFPNQDKFVPTKRGLFLYPDGWVRVIKAIQEVNANDVSTLPDWKPDD